MLPPSEWITLLPSHYLDLTVQEVLHKLVNLDKTHQLNHCLNKHTLSTFFVFVSQAKKTKLKEQVLASSKESPPGLTCLTLCLLSDLHFYLLLLHSTSSVHSPILFLNFLDKLSQYLPLATNPNP